MKARKLGSAERAHHHLCATFVNCCSVAPCVRRSRVGNDVVANVTNVTPSGATPEASMTSEAGLLDICDRQAKLAASLNRRKPSAREQQDAESQAPDATPVCRADATPKPSRSLRTSEACLPA
jgi:hypothetical protein